MDLTLGLSADAYKDPQIERKQLNPKFGLVWNPTDRTTLRLAAFRALKRKVLSGQTIEPTNFVGFNQFFSGINDVNGTETKTAGLAVNHKVSNDLSVGTELARRRVRLPAAQVGATEDVIFRESWSKTYLYWSPTNTSAISIGLDNETLAAPDTSFNPNSLAKSRRTVIPVEWRHFGRAGFLSAIRIASIRQRGEFFSNIAGAYVPGSDKGTVVDLSVGYRFPNRFGMFAFELRNALDDKFAFQEINPQNSLVARRRTGLIKVRINY